MDSESEGFHVLSALRAGHGAGSQIVQATLHIRKRSQRHVMQCERETVPWFQNGQGRRCPEANIDSDGTKVGVDRGDGRIVPRGMDRQGGFSRPNGCKGDGGRGRGTDT